MHRERKQTLSSRRARDHAFPSTSFALTRNGTTDIDDTHERQKSCNFIRGGRYEGDSERDDTEELSSVCFVTLQGMCKKG